MTVAIELSPEIESVLRLKASRQGQELPEYLQTVAERDAFVPMLWDIEQLLTRPQKEQDRIFAEAADAAAPLYEADMALPLGERELTAFMALDDFDPLLENYVINAEG